MAFLKSTAKYAAMTLRDTAKDAAMSVVHDVAKTAAKSGEREATVAMQKLFHASQRGGAAGIANDMTHRELRQIAGAMGIPGRSKLRSKEQLAGAISCYLH